MTGAEAAMVAVSIIGTGYQIHASRKAARQQKRANQEAERIAKRNAEAIEAETQEKVRRTRMQQEQAESRAQALSAASGVEGESVQDYLSFMGEEHARQLGWIKESGQRRAGIARRGGKMQAAQGRAQLTQMRAQTVAGAVDGFGTTYQWGRRAGWWGA